VIYDGHRRSDAARFAGVGMQIIRDWVLRFNAEGPEGLKDRKAPGPPYKLSEEQRSALATVVESDPDPAIRGVVRWLASLRLGDLALGPVRHLVGSDDGRTGVAPDGLRQAFCAPAPLCSGPGRPGGVQDNFPARLKEIRAGLGNGRGRAFGAEGRLGDRFGRRHPAVSSSERYGRGERWCFRCPLHRFATELAAEFVTQGRDGDLPVSRKFEDYLWKRPGTTRARNLLSGWCPDLQLTDHVSLLHGYLKTVYAELSPLFWKDHRKHAPIIDSIVSYRGSGKYRIVVDTLQNHELRLDDPLSPLKMA